MYLFYLLISIVGCLQQPQLRLFQVGSRILLEVGADLAFDGLGAVLVGSYVVVTTLRLDVLSCLQNISIEGTLLVALRLVLELLAAVRVHSRDVPAQGASIHELPIAVRTG